MVNRMFVDVNVIQAVPPSCINRDDTGSPKSSVYGGVRRARISSQSWKKAVRSSFKERFDESDLAMRSTRIVDLIANKIVAIDPSITAEKSQEMAVSLFANTKIKIKESEKNGKKRSETGALFFLSNKQAENLAKLAINGDNDKKDVMAALNGGHGVEISLFGRMVAEEPSLNADASCQVAHAISTHRVDNEYDYYTAVSDVPEDDSSGAGMVGVVEFNSSTLYRYSTVAVHDLVENIGDQDAAARAVTEFIRAFITTMPTGHQNTFANRTVPYAVYVAVRGDQPVNLVGAFEEPVKVSSEDGGYNRESVRKMVDYEKSVEKSFVSKPLVSWQIGCGLEDLGEPCDLESALEAIEGYVKKEF